MSPAFTGRAGLGAGAGADLTAVVFAVFEVAFKVLRDRTRSGAGSVRLRATAGTFEDFADGFGREERVEAVDAAESLAMSGVSMQSKALQAVTMTTR